MALVLLLVIMGLVTTALVISFGRGSSSQEQRVSLMTDISLLTDILPAGEDEIKVPWNNSSGPAVHPPRIDALGYTGTTASPPNRSQKEDVASGLAQEGPQARNGSGEQPRAGRDDYEGRFRFPVPPNDERRRTFGARTVDLYGLAPNGSSSSFPTRNPYAEIWVSIKDLLASMRTVHPRRPSHPDGREERRVSAAARPRMARTTFLSKIPNAVIEIETTDVHKEPVDMKDEEDFRKEHEEAAAEHKGQKRVGWAARIVPAAATNRSHFTGCTPPGQPSSAQRRRVGKA